MPKRNGHVPAYRLHKPSGQARVIIDGKHVYLGVYGSPESREKYARLLAQMSSKQENAVASCHGQSNPDLSVSEMLLAYWQFAQAYYSKDGEPTKELACMREALRPLRRLYGNTRAAEFGPQALKTIRQHMVDELDLCRNVVNRRIGRIKRVFKWAVSEEIVPSGVFHSLQAVPGLRFGRTNARETQPVTPVEDEHVQAILPFLSPHVAAMVMVQRYSGMRPGDVVKMRLRDIDRSGDVWIYEPADHKNRWRGHRRVIPIGPKAQAVLAPFLDRAPDAFLFSPRESEAWRLANRPPYSGHERKTKIYPSELRAREKAKQARRRRKPKRPKRDRYDTGSATVDDEEDPPDQSEDDPTAGYLGITLYPDGRVTRKGHGEIKLDPNRQMYKILKLLHDRGAARARSRGACAVTVTR